MEFVYSNELLIALAFVATLAGFIDAVAGGGGLITLPALLLVQMSPVQALATNKLQGSFGTLSASITMIKKGVLDIKTVKISIITCIIGSALGTLAVQLSPPEALTVIIPVVILIICLYFLFAPKAGELESKPRVSTKMWRYCCVPSMGFYDGYLGPGAGMFYALGGVALRGKALVSATATAKILNFASNIASLIIFILGGKVVWVIGLSMAAGQILGGYVGASFVVKKGTKFIRPIIVIVCISMLAKYLANTPG